jgi:hypothetical protein
MALEKTYVRDGRNHIIGSVTGGFDDESQVVRDEDGDILGRTSELFNTTRDKSGSLISNNTPDSGLIIRRKK